MKKRALKLQTKIIIMITAVVFASIAIILPFITNSVTNNVQEKVEINIMNVAKLIAKSNTVREALINKDPDRIIQPYVKTLLKSSNHIEFIVAAGLLDKIGKVRKGLTGNGTLLKDDREEVKHEEITDEIDYRNLGIGLLLSTTFFVWGKILAKFIPIHSYTLMIISVAIVKEIGIVPRKYEVGAFQWFRFIMVNLTPALLVGMGIAYTNLQSVIDSFTIQYILLVTVTVVGSIIGSGIVGSFFGFYPIESTITAGLCMANMGGTGDVAVLSDSKPMKLMPFAQISSRIGGAFMLILATALLKIFG